MWRQIYSTTTTQREREEKVKQKTESYNETNFFGCEHEQ